VIKRAGLETDYTPPCSAQVKSGGTVDSLPHISSWHGAQLIKHRENVTFVINISYYTASNGQLFVKGLERGMYTWPNLRYYSSISWRG
jgi:hypothetical protein